MKKSHVILLLLVLLSVVVLHDAQKRTTINYADFLKVVKKKDQEMRYNPNEGYEPYWADGEWVLTTTKLPFNVTTTPVPQVCGEECHYIYRRIKEVCVHHSQTWKQFYKSCWRPDCRGLPDTQLDHNFVTYKTYCEFLDAQCKFKFEDPKARLVLIHIGKCIPLVNYFKPVERDWVKPTDKPKGYSPIVSLVRDRMLAYISNFEMKYPTTQE